jgi:hypothetical protein
VQGRVANPETCSVAKIATTAAQAGDARSKSVSRRTAAHIPTRHNRRHVPTYGRSDRRAQCRIRHEMLELSPCSYKKNDDRNRLSRRVRKVGPPLQFSQRTTRRAKSRSNATPALYSFVSRIRMQSRGSVVRSLLQPAAWETTDARDGWHHILRPETNLLRRLRAVHDKC